MSTESRDFDRDAAERLLSGQSAAPPSSLDPLADLLAAASAPGREREFAGEEAAVAAFRAALSPQALSPQESRSSRLPLGRYFTAKVAAVALAATAAGGAAVAATTGVLPIPNVTDSSGPTTTVSPATSGSAHGTAPTHGGGASPTSRPSTPGTTPSQGAAADLCRTLVSGSPGDRARALRSLVAAAGGAQNVPGYCQRLLKPGQSHGSTDKNKNGNNGGNGGGNGDNKGNDGKNGDGKNGNGNKGNGGNTPKKGDAPKKEDDKGDGGNGFGGDGKGDGHGDGHDGHWHGPHWGPSRPGHPGSSPGPGTFFGPGQDHNRPPNRDSGRDSDRGTNRDSGRNTDRTPGQGPHFRRPLPAPHVPGTPHRLAH